MYFNLKQSYKADISNNFELNNYGFWNVWSAYYIRDSRHVGLLFTHKTPIPAIYSGCLSSEDDNFKRWMWISREKGESLQSCVPTICSYILCRSPFGCCANRDFKIYDGKPRRRCPSNNRIRHTKQREF